MITSAALLLPLSHKNLIRLHPVVFLPVRPFLAGRAAVNRSERHSEGGDLKKGALLLYVRTNKNARRSPSFPFLSSLFPSNVCRLVSVLFWPIMSARRVVSVWRERTPMRASFSWGKNGSYELVQMCERRVLFVRRVVSLRLSIRLWNCKIFVCYYYYTRTFGSKKFAMNKNIKKLQIL